ncbi:MAG TPA: hypothetical protein VHR88_09255 [Solirubrobacteraceae bacterium]|jgi:hypothetical protein|nr:hypothetical protein [Solirubrobacteraceae bacterium]
MRISKRAVAALVAVGAIAIASMAIAVSASGADPGDQDGDGNGAPLLTATMAPSEPATPSEAAATEPTIHGVVPGGAPWVLQRGDVQLKGDGKLNLRLQGLVIPVAPGNGTPGPVTTINASLYCGADANHTPAATTRTVPISRSGDARIADTISVPPTCLAPVILVHPNPAPDGTSGAYIAVDGWRS